MNSEIIAVYQKQKIVLRPVEVTRYPNEEFQGLTQELSELVKMNEANLLDYIEDNVT